MLDASVAHRKSRLTSPTSVPRTSPRPVTRRSIRVRASPAVPWRLTISGRPSRRFSTSSRGEARAVGEASEDRRAGAVVPIELQGVKPLARQKIETRADHLGLVGRLPGGLRRLQHTRGNAFEGGVEEKQTLVDRQPERLVGLMQPALTLTAQLAGHVTVGDGRDHGNRQDRAPHEEQEESSPEPALQRRRG